MDGDPAPLLTSLRPLIAQLDAAAFVDNVARMDQIVSNTYARPKLYALVLGIYAAHMGPICANGLLHAAADLCGTDVRDLGDGVRGRRVAVIGGGVVG